jgi:hypothetical protein
LSRRWDSSLIHAALRRSSIESGGFLVALALMVAAAIRLRRALCCAPWPSPSARSPVLRWSMRGGKRAPGSCVVRSGGAARVSPLRSDCLPQALAAAMLCRWLMAPVALHLGVRRETKGQALRPLEAHAWVTAGPVAVSGGDGFESLVAVACFLSHRRA